MAGALTGNAAGFSYMQIFTKNATGEAIGQVTTLAQDATSHALIVGGIVDTDFNPRDPITVEFRGGDAIRGKMGFGGGDIQPFTINLEELNATAIALLTGANVDNTTNSVWQVAGVNATQSNLTDVGVMLTQRFQSRDSATSGINQYITHILPACDIRPLPGGMSYTAVSTQKFSITPSAASKFPFGLAFGANQGWQDNETDYFWITADNPLALTAYTGDGATASFVTGYRPSSSVVTVNASPNAYYENGVAEAPTTVITTTGVVTPDAAPAADKRCVILYETTFVAI